LKETQFN